MRALRAVLMPWSRGLSMTVLVTASLAGCTRGAFAAPVVHHVHIESQRFVPDSIVVQVGDRIVWDNRDLVPHTATALSKEWDTGLIKPGAEAVVTVRRAGPARYHCVYHLHMAATLQVRPLRAR